MVTSHAPQGDSMRAANAAAGGGGGTIIPPDSDMSKAKKKTRITYFAPPKPPIRGESLGSKLDDISTSNSLGRGIGGSSYHATNSYGSRRRSNFEEAVANLQQQQHQQQHRYDHASHDEQIKEEGKKAMHSNIDGEEQLAPMPPGQDDEEVPQIRNWLSDMGGEKDEPGDAVSAAPPPPQLEYDTSGRIVKSKSNNLAAALAGAGGAPGAYSAGPPGMDEEYRNTPDNYGQLGVIGRGSVRSSTKSQKQEDSKELRNSSTQQNNGKRGRVVVEGTLEEDPSSTVWWKRKPVILVILLIVIVAIVVPIVIVLQSGSSSDLETTQQQQIEEEPMEEEEWVPLVPNMTTATTLALEDPFSQQSQAYEWIAEDPNWETYQDWRKQQRFAMMCYYYAFKGTMGSGVTNRFAPRHTSHECDWLLSFSSCRNNDRGEINRIGLISYLSIQFVGTMPPEIAVLSNLEAIEFLGEIDMRPLGDMFPLETIHSLPRINSLIFDQCRLRGSIPSTLGLITSLTTLELFDNSLESTIPSQLGLLYNLTALSLSSNGLTGSIPEEIGKLPFVINFDITNNPDLEPSTPAGFCSDDRIPFKSIGTDWCSNSAECCDS